MDEREKQRRVRHRLAMLHHAEEVSGNVAATCRYYGISRQCFYKWQRRYDELGEAGLRDGSSAPLRSPNQTKAEVVGKIIYLRSNYHFGPQEIAMYQRYLYETVRSPNNRIGVARGSFIAESGCADAARTRCALTAREPTAPGPANRAVDRLVTQDGQDT